MTTATITMPTKHRRIGVVCDQELEAALRNARAELGDDLAEATLVRQLALRGAEAVSGRPAMTEIERWLVEEHGATLAKGSFSDWLDDNPPLPPVAPGEPILREILDDLRRDFDE